MKYIFECEICGFQSENENEVSRCERQGKPQNKFKPRQIVEYRCCTHRKWIKVEIKSVEVEKITHKLLYILKDKDEGKLPLWERNEWKYCVPEEKIRSIK